MNLGSLQLSDELMIVSHVSSAMERIITSQELREVVHCLDTKQLFGL